MFRAMSILEIRRRNWRGIIMMEMSGRIRCQWWEDKEGFANSLLGLGREDLDQMVQKITGDRL